MNFDFFSEMVEFMKKVAALGEELTVEERNLISVAYKNVIGARRASWRIISSLEAKEESVNDVNVEITRQYRHKASIFNNNNDNILNLLFHRVKFSWCLVQFQICNIAGWERIEGYL